MHAGGEQSRLSPPIQLAAVHLRLALVAGGEHADIPTLGHAGAQGRQVLFPVVAVGLTQEGGGTDVCHGLIVVRSRYILIEQAQQITAVFVAFHRITQSAELVSADVTHPAGNLLRAGDHHPLPILDRLDEVSRLEERLVGAGVQPGDAAAHDIHAQLAGSR